MKLFADDGQGYCYGFALADGFAVVEIDPTSREVRKVADSFTDFLEKDPVYPPE